MIVYLVSGGFQVDVQFCNFHLFCFYFFPFLVIFYSYAMLGCTIYHPSPSFSHLYIQNLGEFDERDKLLISAISLFKV